MKPLFTTIGILVVILIIVIWQFGFFSKQVNDITKKMDRATAVQKAENLIAEYKAKADALQEKSRILKIKAKTMELAIEHEQEDLSKTESAVKQLAAAIKAAGLPKPSESGTLTDEQKETKIVFGGKEGTAMDAYNQLFKWNEEFKQKKSVVDDKVALITNQNNAADKLLEKQKEMYAAIERIKTKLSTLESEREISKVYKELADLEASTEGVPSGDWETPLKVLEDEINENKAHTMVIQQEAGKPTNGDVFSKPDPSAAENKNALDDLWE